MKFKKILSMVSMAFFVSACPFSSEEFSIEPGQITDIAAWNDKMPTISFGRSNVLKKKAIIKGVFHCLDISSTIKSKAKLTSPEELELAGTSQIDCSKSKKHELYFFTTEKFLSANVIVEFIFEETHQKIIRLNRKLIVKDTH